MKSIFKNTRDLFLKIFSGKKSFETFEIPAHPIQVELADTIAKARDEAIGASSRAKVIAEDMQSVIDEADVTIPLVSYIKPQNAEELLDIWFSIGQQASRIHMGLESFQGYTGGTVSSTSTSTVVISRNYLHNGLFVDAGGFETAWLQYTEFAKRPSLKSEVAELLREYGFDKPQFPGEKSPLEQFEIAHKAFDGPITATNPISTSLIPIRECIKSVIDGLVSMRPFQEEAKSQKNKILSIGKQLGRDSLPKEVIEVLAEEWDDLNKGDLSLSKRREIPRVEWLNQLIRGTSFLRSLLKGLDSNKFKR